MKCDHTKVFKAPKVVNSLKLNKGLDDSWLLKLDSERSFGGVYRDLGNNVLEATISGYYIAATTKSIEGCPQLKKTHY